MLKQLIKKLEDLKVDIFDSYTRVKRVELIRKEIYETNKYVDRLIAQKHSLDGFAAKSTAIYARHQYLIGCSIRRNNSKKELSYWEKPNSLINEAYKNLSQYQLDDNDFREISQCNLWKNIWTVRKGTSLFGRSVVDYSTSQRNLVAWSNLYDNVYKNPECPPDRVVEDHDMLDGWLIKQKRNRDSQINKDLIESGISDKIRNCEEVYILCDPENIKDIFEMNDMAGKVGWTKRMSQIKRSSGILKDQELIDTREQLQMRINAAKGK